MDDDDKHKKTIKTYPACKESEDEMNQKRTILLRICTSYVHSEELVTFSSVGRVGTGVTI